MQCNGDGGGGDAGTEQVDASDAVDGKVIRARRSIAPPIGTDEQIRRARDRAYNQFVDLVSSLPAEVVGTMSLARAVDDFMEMARGNVLHNGMGYPAEHLRIHAYLYPPGYNHPSEVEFQETPTGPGAS